MRIGFPTRTLETKDEEGKKNMEGAAQTRGLKDWYAGKSKPGRHHGNGDGTRRCRSEVR